MNDVQLNYTEGHLCDAQLQRDDQHDEVFQVLKGEKRGQTQENWKRP